MAVSRGDDILCDAVACVECKAAVPFVVPLTSPSPKSYISLFDLSEESHVEILMSNESETLPVRLLVIYSFRRMRCPRPDPRR